MKLSQSKKFEKLRKLLDKQPPHKADLQYEFLKDLGLPVKQKLLGQQRPVEFKANSFIQRTGPLYHNHRRGLLQFENYMEADAWCTNRKNVQGQCSFFIKGYKWPWHTRKNYVGLLFPTDAAFRKG